MSESRAQEIEIKAEFRPSLLNRGQDGFQNKTESTGICAKTDVNGRNFQEICKTQGLFSIALQGEAIQQEDIPERGDARKALYFKWPRKENILLQNQQVGTEKKTANFTITNMSATYLERFTGLPSNNYNSHFNTNYTTEWWRAWENGDPENSTAPCKATYKGLGITVSGSYQPVMFMWDIPPDSGICYKKSRLIRPVAEPYDSSNSRHVYSGNPESREPAKIKDISFTYKLKLPDPLSMASGTYTNADTLTSFRIGNDEGVDIDFGNNFIWQGDPNVTLKFILEVAHDLKITPEFGAEKVILVPQDGSQRGWDRYLSGGSKPTKLTGRSKFRLSSSGEFTVYLQCGTPFSDTECALTSEDTKRTVPVRAFLTLASNIVAKDSSQKSVTRQPLRTKKDLPRNVFHTNNPAQNYPGHIDFEVSGEQSIKTLLAKAPDTYKDTVTVIFDANIHA